MCRRLRPEGMVASSIATIPQCWRTRTSASTFDAQHQRNSDETIHLGRPSRARLPRICPQPSAAQTTPRRADLGALSHSLEGVVSRIAPAVVQIQVAAYGPVGAGSTGANALIGTQRSTGSGVILSRDGFIITNAHVIEGGRRFLVIVPRPAVAGSPNRSVLPPVSLELPAKLVGVDQETDLAVLKVEAKDLPFARLGDSDSLARGAGGAGVRQPVRARQQRNHGRGERDGPPVPR